jgi:protein-S-isoprenylcysteine O-methyltransferase Ste14
MIATAGVIVLLRSLKEVSIKSFLGIKQDKSAGSVPELVISGIYSQIRHPLYLGLVAVFFGYFLVSGTVGALIHLGCLITYLPLGIYFEEKNLIAFFGENYREYRREVPAFLPRIHKKRG